MRLGQILLHHGCINHSELAEALQEQENSKKRIGHILMEKGYVHKKDLLRGLKLQSILIAAGLTAAISCASVLEGHELIATGVKNSDLRVKATVALRSQITILGQHPVLVLTDEDIDRGYVDIRAATRMTIKNNNKSGYILVFEGLGWPFREVLVSGLARDVQINSAGAFIHQPYARSTVTAELSYRFVLSEDARAGEYPWPLSISMQPAS